jgi:hypothetical protein
MQKSLLILICLYCGLFASVNAQQRYYVNKTASGQQTGINWQDAFTELHNALQLAQNGDEIWVAQGLYLPDSGTTHRNRYFELHSGVKLLGGFAGTEITSSERDPELHNTVLSGNIGNPMDSTDNAFTVLYMALPNPDTYVSGFILEHGYAQSDTSFGNISPSRSGGALYILANKGEAYPVFDRCVFRNNYAGGHGGAVMVRSLQSLGSSPQFRYCKFLNNRCGYDGGAVWFQGGSEVERGVEFYYCDFIGNRAGNIPATRAGGVYYWKNIGRDTLEFNNCRMISNSARGIAVFLATDCSVPEKHISIDSCYISKNFVPGNDDNNIGASFAGLTIYDYSNFSNIRLKNNVFEYQDGAKNGYIIYSSPSSEGNTLDFSFNYFKNCIGNSFFDKCKNAKIESNIYENGGDLHIRGQKLVAINNVFTSSSVLSLQRNYYSGSSTLFQNNYFNGKNGSTPYGMLDFGYEWTVQDTLFLLNNTILNTKVKVPDFWIPPSTANRKTYAQNNIFLNNSDALSGVKRLPFWHGLDEIELDHNMMDFNCNSIIAAEVNCGTQNIMVTEWPFVDTLAGDYHLRPCSEGVNGGTSELLQQWGIATDLDGETRIQGTAPDLGAYENIPLVLTGQFEPNNACFETPSGNISYDIAGGCSPYTIYLVDSNGVVFDRTENLPASTYTIYASDQQGNTFQSVAEVGQWSELQLPSSVTQPSAVTNADGSIKIFPSGGLAPYTALWADGMDGLERLNLLQNTYSVTITDASGCTMSDTFFLSSVGILGINTAKDLKIWPNPADNAFFIQGVNVKSVKLYDSMGKMVLESHSVMPQSGYATMQLPSGLYYVEVISKDNLVGYCKLSLIRD